MLLSEVATNYVQLRTYEQRLAYARQNVTIQSRSLSLAEARFNTGRGTELDVRQARSSVSQTESQIPPLITGRRQAANQLCTLLGVPVANLADELQASPIPNAPPRGRRGHPGRLDPQTTRHPPGRAAGRRADAANRRGRGGPLSAFFAQRVCRIRGGRLQGPVYVQEFHRPVLPDDAMERAQLRPHSQQHPRAGREVPGSDAAVSADRAYGRPRSGRRACRVPASSAAGGLSGTNGRRMSGARWS